MSKENIAWVKDAVFYHIYPLGMTGAPDYHEGEKTKGNRILQVLDWIPHLKELGVNAIYFGPIFQSVAHGYDTSNYYETDMRLGSKEDFKHVFEELKKNGMRIVLDGVFNHVGRGFWAFNDVQAKGQNSPYVNWFYNLNFHEKSPAGDNFSYEMWEGNGDLVKLNLKNQDVINHLLSAVGMWMEEFDIDGLRLDAADCVDSDFFKLLHNYTKERKPDFWLMGEIIHGDYRTWANDTMLDSTTNYECFKGIYSSHNDKNYFEIAYSLKRQFGDGGIYKHLDLYNFLDNHDVNRVASLLHNKQDLKNVYTLLFTMPGVPSVYYGSEFGISGEKTQGFGADKPVRPALHISDSFERDEKLLEHIKKLSALRKSSDALKYGDYEEVLVSNEYFVFARNYKKETKLVVLNCSDTEKMVQFRYGNQDYQLRMMAHSSYIK